MIIKLRRLSWVDITLVIILVIGAAVIFSASQTKADLAQDKTRLETHRRAAELDLGDTGKEIDLESLRQSLEQARAALAQSSLPSEADAIAVTAQILQYAKANNITITRWYSGYTSSSLNGRTYSAITHSLSVQGKTASLISFSKALTRASVAPVVSSLDITGVGGQENLWQVELELLVHYR